MEKSNVKGDPEKCKICGHDKSAHTGILNTCPEERFKYHSFKSNFNHDGTLNHEYADNPICPYCGYENSDWQEYGDEIISKESIRMDCLSCEQLFDCEPCVSYSFSTFQVDFEKEKLEEAEKAAKRKAWREAEAEKARKFMPGMRIRVKEENRTIYRTWEGVVANKKHCDDLFVDITIINPETGEPVNIFFGPDDLEIL